jgi:imidazolonepropionase-like amidohydrolase
MASLVKVIKGGKLIDGTGKEPLNDSVIVVEDKKITQVGRVGEVSMPAGADVISADGCVVMPGLIDCHGHIDHQFTPLASSGFGFLDMSDIDRAVRVCANAKALLEAGITTFRDVGSHSAIDIALRDAIKDGVVVGPRIVACGRGLTITGGHVDSERNIRYLTFRNILNNTHVASCRVTDGVDDVIKAVREEVKLGADFIKFWGTGGVLEATVRYGAREYSDEEIYALVQEASRAKIPVAVHAMVPEAIKVCIEAGVRSIEHGIFSDEECVKAMKEKGVFLVPTLVAYEMLATHTELPVATVEVAKKAVVAHEATIRAAKKAGVKIAMGTDSGSPFNYHAKCQPRELELMARRGLTEMECIVASTKTAAECCGIGDTTGTLESGKMADLIIVEGNPLQEIKVFQDKSRIKTVMKEGTVFVRRP